MACLLSSSRYRITPDSSAGAPLTNEQWAIKHGSIYELRCLASDPEACEVSQKASSFNNVLATSARTFAARTDFRGRVREYDHIFMDACCAPIEPRRNNVHKAKTALDDALACANVQSMRRCASLVESWLSGVHGHAELRAMVWSTRTLGERLARGEFLGDVYHGEEPSFVPPPAAAPHTALDEVRHSDISAWRAPVPRRLPSPRASLCGLMRPSGAHAAASTHAASTLALAQHALASASIERSQSSRGSSERAGERPPSAEGRYLSGIQER